MLARSCLNGSRAKIRRTIGSKNSSGKLTVIVGRQLVADVVEEVGHDRLLVRAVAVGSGGTLETVLHSVDLEWERLVLEPPKQAQHSIDQALGVASLVLLDELIVLAGAVLHPGDADGLLVNCGAWHVWSAAPPSDPPAIHGEGTDPAFPGGRRSSSSARSRRGLWSPEADVPPARANGS